MRLWSLTFLTVLGLTGLVNAQTLNLMRMPPGPAPVPGNLLLALSVEFPTGLQASYPTASYNAGIEYDGYFDRRKCYEYSTTSQLFLPAAAALSGFTCASANHWGGNLLNWLTMTNLDQFRLVMTGGTRDNFTGLSPGDTTEQTVLIRARSDRNAYNPDRWIGAGDPAPAAVRNQWMYLGGRDTRMLSQNGQQFQIRVEVCKSVGGVGIDSFCKTGYQGAPKPEGLVQRYADRLRVGATGYLLEDSNDRNGAVIRAALNDTRQEWSAQTGVQQVNPYPADAAANGVPRSGLINYLNNFGYFSGYKGLDPVGELYYASLLYLRGRPLPPDYTSGLTMRNLDSFPAVSGDSLLRGGARDPVVNQCQKNFILGLGDIYTHCDGNLPGGSTSCPGGYPADPDGLNVSTLWSRITALEGTDSWTGGANGRNAYMAGLAHWANTQDIRSDLPGKQTVRTYWVDVLENGNGVGGSMPAAGRVRSQYWLATKYGGFDNRLISGDNPNSKSSTWDADGDGVPDTWFAGNTPTALRAGLTRAFDEIASQATSVPAGSGGSNIKAGIGGQAYISGYDATRWKGELKAIAITAAGAVSDVLWDAGKALDQRDLNGSPRRLFTHKGDGPVAFEWDKLSDAQRTVIRGTEPETVGEQRLLYLRGDRSRELPLGTLRQRDSRLGSLVNSSPLYMGPPTLSQTNSASRKAFIQSQRNRTPVLFVGSNAGVMHAFDARPTGGQELFGYVPLGVYSKLRDYTLPGYQHQFMVDGSPMMADAEVDGEWRSVLVGTLGLGGRGYFILDVTSAATFSATDVWLDRTQPDGPHADVIGHMTSPPALEEFDPNRTQQITKLNNGRWAVVLGNGVNSPSGKAALIIQYLDRDRSLQVITTDNDTTGNGLATPRLVDLDGNGTADLAYAGDLKGNLWSFDLSDKQGDWKVRFSGSPLFKAQTAGQPQPITSAPYVLRVPKTQQLQVAFGTGRLLDINDPSDSHLQTIYSVRDVLSHSRNSNGQVVLGAGTPIQNGRDALVQQTSSAFSNRYAATSNHVVDYTGLKGWYLDLSVPRERQIANTDLFQGSIVRFRSMVPPMNIDCDNTSNGRYFSTYLDIFSGRRATQSVFGLTSNQETRVELGDGVPISIKKHNGETIIQCKGMECKQDSLTPVNMVRSAPKAELVDWRRLQ